MAEGTNRNQDLVLAPGEFAFILDTTKGLVNVVVGPNKISMSTTDQPVLWDKSLRRFARCPLENAVQINTIAPEGYYIALYNPATDGKLEHPREGAISISTTLDVGHRINIPGPANFPLWPGQMASVIQGHHLHSNQYLLAQVYNDTEATANWKDAVLKPQIGDAAVVVPPVPAPVTPLNRAFVPGQQLIIKGTDVSFFIPPTGIKVVPENGGKTFVREAVTLERLEYCILLDEDGNKRFVKGPSVVFPEPTEQFILKDGLRKFKAIELNETTGLYIKVIADYEENGVKHKAGDELFITGKEQAIYFQREEHSIIRYGDQTKHYAIAIPAGEGRYVLDRNSGKIDLIKGPTMLLCDPRHQVVVRRVLAQSTAALWYPGNPKILKINKDLEDMNATTDASQYEPGRVASASYLASASLSNTGTNAAQVSRQIAGDTFVRGGSFTPPRTITLDTKYEGAVSISIWTGYAVLVIDKTGHRHVANGPQNILLEYDETLAPLELSTGTPKNDTNLYRTAYLRVHNNKVSDRVSVETKDLVKLNVSASYRVNFEGEDQEKWFAVENYVRLLCDHMRSLIRNTVKRRSIEDFYSNAIDIIRDSILGPAPAVPGPREGRKFLENGMRVYDVEVLDVTIDDKSVANLLLDAQSDALKSAILLSKEERALDVTKKIEVIKQERATAVTETVLRKNTLEEEEIKSALTTNLSRIGAESTLAAEKLQNNVASQAGLNELNAAEIARLAAVDDQRLIIRSREITLEMNRLVKETEEIAKRAGAVTPTLAAALTVFSDQALVKEISTALAPMAMMNGVSAAEILAKLFGGTPLENVMNQLASRSRIPVRVGNGESN